MARFKFRSPIRKARQLGRSALTRGRTALEEGRLQARLAKLPRISLADRQLLARLTRGPTKDASQLSRLRRLERFGFVRQTDVFPPAFSITGDGRDILGRVAGLRKLQGVRIDLIPPQLKALRLLEKGDLVFKDKLTGGEASTVHSLKRRGLLERVQKRQKAKKRVPARRAKSTALRDISARPAQPARAAKPEIFRITARGRTVLKEHE